MNSHEEWEESVKRRARIAQNKALRKHLKCVIANQRWSDAYRSGLSINEMGAVYAERRLELEQLDIEIAKDELLEEEANNRAKVRALPAEVSQQPPDTSEPKVDAEVLSARYTTQDAQQKRLDRLFETVPELDTTSEDWPYGAAAATRLGIEPDSLCSMRHAKGALKSKNKMYGIDSSGNCYRKAKNGHCHYWLPKSNK